MGAVYYDRQRNGPDHWFVRFFFKVRNPWIFILRHVLKRCLLPVTLENEMWGNCNSVRATVALKYNNVCSLILKPGIVQLPQCNSTASDRLCVNCTLNRH
jgi:hypothetical protein